MFPANIMLPYQQFIILIYHMDITPYNRKRIYCSYFDVNDIILYNVLYISPHLQSFRICSI